eukprot:TRINITY_DN20946_c0_g1_i1.p1 TRINITY_DN20946_c0_g1~~TRINITY_DN20946_c0_g1_i1.p1  ORF type:complete len:368 (+),score=93.50 TRINITY_DN20946_c0_g1_i1:98-1201(+)
MVVYVGADIGGSLCKLVIHAQEAALMKLLRMERWHVLPTSDDDPLKVVMGSIPTTAKAISDVISHLQRVTVEGEEVVIAFTGGGVIKHRRLIDRLRNVSGVDLCTRNDEFKALALGVDFMMGHRVHDFFRLTNFAFHGDTGPDRAKVTIVPLDIAQPTPMLAVSIGTGTSFVDLTGNGHVRVGGSSLGGGTFMGLCKGLARCETFGDAMNLAMRGNSRNVDMVVGDIYGDDATQSLSGDAAPAKPKKGAKGVFHGLRRSTLASSFAKLAGSHTASDADKCLSSLIMVSMNVAALAHLHARLHNRDLILFTGSFLQSNPMALRTLAYAIDFWSAGKRSAVFVQHCSHLGALGSLSTLIRPSLRRPARL